MSDGEPMRVLLPREHAGSVRLEMLWSPAGPDTGSDEAEQCRVLAHGSAFFYETDNRLFLVTARHNFTGRHWQTNACLGAYPVSPTHVRFAIMAKPQDEKGWRFDISEDDSQPTNGQIALKIFMLPLINEEWESIWLQHPTLGGDVDVAVLPVSLKDDGLIVNQWVFPVVDRRPEGYAWPDLAPGQNVFIVGYPDGLVSGPLLPLWIRGSIASDPHFGFSVDGGAHLPLMLVDARTRQGQSGSVVIRHIPAATFVRRNDGVGATTETTLSQVVGCYSGRTSDESDLGFVWRIDEVDRICREGDVPGS